MHNLALLHMMISIAMVTMMMTTMMAVNDNDNYHGDNDDNDDDNDNYHGDNDENNDDNSDADNHDHTTLCVRGIMLN